MSHATKTDLLAPFEIWEVMLDNATIKFFKPLIVKPEILPPEEPGDPTYWTVDLPELDVSAVGISMEELMNCVRSDIRMIWKNCVRKDDSALTPKNRNIKRQYLLIAEEVDG
ncbi:MAG: hypothetical protein LBI05_01535 [Planctomycetaceae bacterium]|jgi:hypothetical protein|nr:hypothetical protein [Planctomycetaceae bacterium]